jgi:L-asparagine transporter-like permease
MWLALKSSATFSSLAIPGLLIGFVAGFTYVYTVFFVAIVHLNIMCLLIDSWTSRSRCRKLGNIAMVLVLVSRHLRFATFLVIILDVLTSIAGILKSAERKRHQPLLRAYSVSLVLMKLYRSHQIHSCVGSFMRRCSNKRYESVRTMFKFVRLHSLATFTLLCMYLCGIMLYIMAAFCQTNYNRIVICLFLWSLKG